MSTGLSACHASLATVWWERGTSFILEGKMTIPVIRILYIVGLQARKVWITFVELSQFFSPAFLIGQPIVGKWDESGEIQYCQAVLGVVLSLPRVCLECKVSSVSVHETTFFSSRTLCCKNLSKSVGQLGISNRLVVHLSKELLV